MSASKSGDKVYLNIVNRDTANSCPVEFMISDRKIKSINATKMHHDDITAENTFESPDMLRIEKIDGVKDIVLEPLSVYVFEITLE